MAHAIDDLKMVHEEEMKNYDRIESAVVSVMRRHGCKIIQTPTFEDYDTYGTYFPQLQRLHQPGLTGNCLLHPHQPVSVFIQTAAGCDGAAREDGVARVSGCAAAFEIRLRVDGLP